ncbi:MAG: ATP-dependent Clp protease proteolytic subunit [Epsilonproteobacteria bacterium]|nr:ATP-dependent Clp protease proteolytic subunit [Campylobacterota bacterium]
MDNKKNSDISSEEHTLFVKYIAEQKKPVDRARKIYEVSPKYRVFTVYIEKFKEFKRGLHAVLNELRAAGPDDVLELRINSSGGLVNEGKQFYNLIEEKFHKRTVAYLDNRGYSMGALLFCMADRRVIYPYSDLMFHNYSSGVSGKGGEILSHVTHKDKILIKFFQSLIVKRGFLTQDEFENMLIGKDYWMDAQEMCRRKIATHVIYKGRQIKARKYLKLLEQQS